MSYILLIHNNARHLSVAASSPLFSANDVIIFSPDAISDLKMSRLYPLVSVEGSFDAQDI